jgi:tetratricopeptide (TPR) repeat protein
MPDAAPAPDAQFVQGFLNYLRYWQAETADLDDAAIQQLEPDFPNLLRAVEMGLAAPQTQRETAVLMRQCFFWIQGSGRMIRWTALLERAAKALPPDAARLRLRLMLQLGQLQRLQQHLTAARRAFDHALALAQRLDEPRLLTETYINLCQTCQQAGELTQAETYGRQALAHLPPDRPRLQMIIWQTLGRIAHAQGRPEQAVAWLRRAKDAPGQSLVDRARNMDLLANALQQQEQYEEAIALYQDVDLLLQDTPHRSDRINSLLNLGALYFAREEYEEAEATFRRGERLLRGAAALTFYRGWLYNNLGCALREQERYGEAEGYFRQSLVHYRQAENDLFLANAHGNLAVLYARRERGDAARDHYQKALALLAAYPDHADAAAWRRDFAAEMAALST